MPRSRVLGFWKWVFGVDPEATVWLHLRDRLQIAAQDSLLDRPFGAAAQVINYPDTRRYCRRVGSLAVDELVRERDIAAILSNSPRSRFFLGGSCQGPCYEMSIKTSEFHASEAWQSFRRQGEEAYRSFLAGDPTKLRNHNIVKDGEVELDFVLSLAGISAAPAGATALDVGCGGGYLSDCLRKRGYVVTGIDISQAAVEIARRQFPSVRYVVGDGAQPMEHVAAEQFDLIYIREFHPFTRIDDFPYQLRILLDYFALLKPTGWVVLGHARRPPGLDYARLLEYCRTHDIRTIGPVFLFLNKRFRVPSRWRLVTHMLSSLSALLAGLTRRRWIEFLLLQR